MKYYALLSFLKKLQSLKMMSMALYGKDTLVKSHQDFPMLQNDQLTCSLMTFLKVTEKS